MKGNKVYFILYIVLIVELLAVIQERDVLQEMEEEIRNKMLVTMADMYKEDVTIVISEKASKYIIDRNTTKKTVIDVMGLYSEAEQKHANLKINVISTKAPRNWPNGGIKLGDKTDRYNFYRDKANYIFESNIPNIGEFTFVVEGNATRILPDYLPHDLLEELKDSIGEYSLGKVLKEEQFIISALSKNTNIDPDPGGID